MRGRGTCPGQQGPHRAEPTLSCLRERTLAGTAPGTNRTQFRAQARAEALPALFPSSQHSFPSLVSGVLPPHPRGQPHL